ncbi:MAG: hypothetical protein WDZ49_07815 [Litorilinea sp.]
MPESGVPESDAPTPAAPRADHETDDEPRASTRTDAFDAQPWLDYGFEEGDFGGSFEDDPTPGGFDADSDADGWPSVTPGFDEPDAVPDDASDADERGTVDPTRGPRLVTGIQGLLDPIRISRRLEETQTPDPPSRAVGSAAGDGARLEKLRRFRNLLYEDPRLTGNRRRRPHVSTRAFLYIPWIFLLVAVLTIGPLVLGWGEAENLPPEWPGVAEAFALVDGLSPDAVVLVYWAYDPATAGELDLAARPMLQHLLARRAQVVGVSTLPAGPASARRVVGTVRQTRDAAGMFSEASRNPWPVQVAFLPGGASALPLAATDLDRALGFVADDLPARAPVLSVILAARAEDAQQWLEQVQTRTGVPTVAVVSAGADPTLRPYLDSGQLRGLVSGFDGAFHYQARLDGGDDPTATGISTATLRQHVNAQNWAHLAILAVLILGNLAAILGRAGQR